jgi:hypothetical protein
MYSSLMTRAQKACSLGEDLARILKMPERSATVNAASVIECCTIVMNDGKYDPISALSSAAIVVIAAFFSKTGLFLNFRLFVISACAADPDQRPHRLTRATACVCLQTSSR